MGYKVYSNEFKAQVVEFYKTHSTYETIKEFDVSRTAITNWCKQLGFFKGCSNYKISFKHEVCQYYDNNTLDQTYAKYGIPSKTVCRWRRELGYRNKSRGYNLYMEGLQPVMQKREVLNFKSVRSENGDMKFELVKKEKRIKELEMSVEKYDQILSSIRQLFN